MSIVRRFSETRLESLLIRLLARWIEKWGGETCTFERRMLLTDNRGVIFTAPDGSEYQITIVQSKPAR